MQLKYGLTFIRKTKKKETVANIVNKKLIEAYTNNCVYLFRNCVYLNTFKRSRLLSMKLKQFSLIRSATSFLKLF